MQVVAPSVPSVAARSRIILVLDTLGIEELQRGQAVLIGNILRVALGEDELAHIGIEPLGITTIIGSIFPSAIIGTAQHASNRVERTFFIIFSAN
jgi:hypothetical protein